MSAADQAAAPVPGSVTPNRVAAPAAVGHTGSAAPVRVASAGARFTVAAARQAAAGTTRPAPQARSVAVPRTPPVRPPEHTVLPAAPAPPAEADGGGGLKELLGRIDLVQVVCWQAAVLAVVLTARQSLPVLVGAVLGAAALIVLTTVRIDGRRLYEQGGLGLAYLCRSRRWDLPEDAGKTPALLDLLVPGCTVRAIETGHGPAMATSHRGGLTALLRLGDGDADPAHRLPAPAALLELLDGRQRDVGVQAVYHAGVRRDGPIKVWLAVQAARGVGASGDGELALVLRNALRRLRHALDRVGIPIEPLTEEVALATVAGLAHVTGGRNRVREDWRYWHTGGVRQATFRLQGWHRLADPQASALLSDLFGVATVAVTVTVAARPGADGPRVESVLRIAATSEAAIETAGAALAARAAARGIGLVRLNGTHSRSVAASLPIGVFLS
ncbi:type VII secretion protein EccE [Plantactinospora sp. CA-290183]|uniref:type VII secretion protein EccE n=1 Tax=Plantactinospora sp. CA-290183 TaxID=3240006 RepID=UPI003D931A21